MMHGLLIRPVDRRENFIWPYQFPIALIASPILGLIFLFLFSQGPQGPRGTPGIPGSKGRMVRTVFTFLELVALIPGFVWASLVLMSDHGNISDPWSSVLHYNVVPIKQRLEQLKGMCCPSTWPRFLYRCIYSCFISRKTLMSKHIKVMSTAETPRGREVNNS